MVKFIGADVTAVVPPPYSPPEVAGLVTVTGTMPVDISAEAGTVAWSLVELTTVVVNARPLKLMTAWEAKLVPSTSSGTEVPAGALAGVSWMMFGVAPIFLEYPHPRPVAITPTSKIILTVLKVFMVQSPKGQGPVRSSLESPAKGLVSGPSFRRHFQVNSSYVMFQ